MQRIWEFFLKNKAYKLYHSLGIPVNSVSKGILRDIIRENDVRQDIIGCLDIEKRQFEQLRDIIGRAKRSSLWL